MTRQCPECGVTFDPQGKARGRKRYCSRACQLKARHTPPEPDAAPETPRTPTHGATGFRFAVPCLECGSDELTTTARCAEHRSNQTHQAQILTCACGLEMLLALDLSRTTHTGHRPARRAA